MSGAYGHEEYVSVTTLREELGVAVHTAFRKAGASHAARLAHDAIANMPRDDWANVLDFVIRGLPKLQAAPFVEAAPKATPPRKGRAPK